jgi:hypothetical protein
MSIDTITQSTFDYEQIDEADRAMMRHYAKYIRRMEGKTIEGLLLIGETLVDAKARSKGKFGKWCESEFDGWSDDTAYRYIRIYEAHKSLPQIAGLNRSALHVLLAPEVAPAAIQEALEVKEAGEPVTVAKAKEIAEKHKPPKKPKAKPAPVVVEDEADDSEEPEGESWDPMEEPQLPKGETVFTRLRELFDEMSPLQRVTAGGMWRNWCDPE